MREHGLLCRLGLTAIAVLSALALGCGRLGAGSTAGEFMGTTSSGLPITCRLLAYDRNEIVASVMVGDRLVALTGSGYLLSFDRRTFQLKTEDPGHVVRCLGHGPDNSVLAGLEGGAVAQVDPETLHLTEVGRLSQTAQWIGTLPAKGGEPSHVLALVPDTFDSPLKEQGLAQEVFPPCLMDVTATQVYRMGEPSASGRGVYVYLVDSKGRLWVGEDKGEWGGSCGWFDTVSKTFHAIKSDDGKNFGGNVYGFSELSDGRILVFGGCIHFSASTYIAEAKEGVLSDLYHWPEFMGLSGPVLRRKRVRAKPPSDRPVLPVTHILENPQTKSLYVFAYSDFFETDPTLTSWKKVAALELRYLPGRPDAMGCYPAVRAVHRTDDGFVLATTGNSYVALNGSRQTCHALAGQLEGDSIHSIINTTKGTLLESMDNREPKWQMVGGQPDLMRLAPPLDASQEGGWTRPQILVGSDGTLYSISSTRHHPVRRAVTRWKSDKPTVLSDQYLPNESWTEPEKTVDRAHYSNADGTATVAESHSFLTPDGIVWRTGLEDKLLRLDAGGKWVTAGAGSDLFIFGSPLRAVNAKGPPWFLQERTGLWCLSYDDQGGAQLEPIEVKTEDGSTHHVFDALEWSGGLLLSTITELLEFDPVSGKAVKSSLRIPCQRIQTLASDGLGRLWIGGDGLWLVDSASREARRVDGVPPLEHNYVTALGRDPKRPDTVLVYGRSGLLSVTVPRR